VGRASRGGLAGARGLGLAAGELVLFAAGGGAGGLGRGAAEGVALLGGHGHQLAPQHRDGKIVVDGYFHQLAVEQAGNDTFFGAREQPYSISYVHKNSTNGRGQAIASKYAKYALKVGRVGRRGENKRLWGPASGTNVCGPRSLKGHEIAQNGLPRVVS